ncbi:MAG: class I SAM-dependent methyltransferase [Candidatus Zixiibacteriota bacterium]
MPSYYSQKLAAERLIKVYDLATPRVRQYLDAELNHVLSHIHPGDAVLDLGCGYGRTLPALVQRAATVIGVDISLASLTLARQRLAEIPNYHLAQMDAAHLGFSDNCFDLIVCIQNGISAFHVDQRTLIVESLRVTKTVGKLLFSTYSAKFWEHRLEWFRLQAAAGLLGEIDEDKTRDGNIVCKDGFTATTVSEQQFRALTTGLDADISIVEVDESSLFCELVKHPIRCHT